MVSEVAKATPESATTSGTIGRPPAAITICSALKEPHSSPSAVTTRSDLGPVNSA